MRVFTRFTPGEISFAALSVAWLMIALGLDSARAQPPVSNLWFTANNGTTTCKVWQVVTTPIQVTYNCSNSYGTFSGAYTANATSGANGTNSFYVGLDSQQVLPVVQNPTLTNIACLVQMNGTAAPVMMLNGVTVPVLSAAYSCTGFASNGQGMVTWP